MVWEVGGFNDFSRRKKIKYASRNGYFDVNHVIKYILLVIF